MVVDVAEVGAEGGGEGGGAGGEGVMGAPVEEVGGGVGEGGEREVFPWTLGFRLKEGIDLVSVIASP